jgi:hypothetical protein
MAKKNATVSVPRAVVARVGVTGMGKRKPPGSKKSAATPPWDIPDTEALVPGAIAIRVRTKSCTTDADLFREVAECVRHWARVFGDSAQKESPAPAVKHARERVARANVLIGSAQHAVEQSGQPSVVEWATLVEAAIHAGSAFTQSVEYVRLRRIRALGSRNANKGKGQATRDKVRAEAIKLPLNMSKAVASQNIGDKIGKAPKHVESLLTAMFPGESWAKRRTG